MLGHLFSSASFKASCKAKISSTLRKLHWTRFYTLAHCDGIMINYTNTLHWYNHTQILHINRRYEGDELCSELFINLYIITTNIKLTYRLEWAAKCKGNNNKNKINENIELYSQNTMTYSQTYKIYDCMFLMRRDRGLQSELTWPNIHN